MAKILIFDNNNNRSIIAAKNTSEKQREIWRCELLNTVTSSKNLNQRVTYKRTRNTFKRKIVKGLFIQRSNRSLKRQLKCFIAQLFPREIT